MKTQPALLMTACLFSLVNLAFVKPLVTNVEEVPKADRWATLGSTLATPAFQKKIKAKTDPLARAGIYSSLENWEMCLQNARLVSAKSVVKDWAIFFELNCSKALADNDVKTKTGKAVGSYVVDALKRADEIKSSHSKILQDKINGAKLQTQLSYCRWLDKKGHWKELHAEVQKALKQENYYSKQDRALLFFFSGNVLVAERQWADAFWNYQRAHDLDPKADLIDARIKAIMPMLPASLKEQIQNQDQASSDNDADDAAPVVAATGINPSSDELDLYNGAQGYIIRNDVPAASEALAKLLHKFPAGIKAKWAQDKLFELLSVEIDKSRGPQGVSVNKKKILNHMLDFDADHTSDWAKLLFDMQAYSDSALLYKHAGEQISGSAKAGHFFYLAGRAFQLSGNFSDAKAMYRVMVKNFPSAPEIVDTGIQWALVDIGGNDPSEAITHLELARSRKMTNQQDLVSLFWLYQSYKMKNATTEMTTAGNDLMKRFGLTYYGLIAFSDSQKKLPEFPKEKSKTGKVYFSLSEVMSLDRAHALLAAGLFDGVADELAPILSRPLNNAEDQVLANVYAQALKYPKAFGLLTNIIDEAPERRSDFIVKELFPKEYWDIVADDKKRSQVDPLLLLSIMKQESAFDREVVSRSGAVGLMQMIPPTAEEVKQDLSATEVDVAKDMTDPTINVRFCAHYFAKLLKRYDGSVPLALAAYNAGPKRISQFVNAKNGALRDTWVDELPWAETSYYVKSILKNYLVYRMLYGSLTELPAPPWSALPVAAHGTPAPTATSSPAP